jgi:hypothetical protein
MRRGKPVPFLPNKLSVYPSDPEGVPEADRNLLPPDGEEACLVPDFSDPARIQPLRKRLKLGHVA